MPYKLYKDCMPGIQVHTILYLNKQKANYRKFCHLKQIKCGFKSHFFLPSSYRITTTAACMMDLRRYPLDEQNCTLEIESCKLLEGKGWPNDNWEMNDIHRLGKTGARCSNTGFSELAHWTYSIYFCNAQAKMCFIHNTNWSKLSKSLVKEGRRVFFED